MGPPRVPYLVEGPILPPAMLPIPPPVIVSQLSSTKNKRSGKKNNFYSSQNKSGRNQPRLVQSTSNREGSPFKTRSRSQVRFVEEPGFYLPPHGIQVYDNASPLRSKSSGRSSMGRMNSNQRSAGILRKHKSPKITKSVTVTKLPTRVHVLNQDLDISPPRHPPIFGDGLRCSPLRSRSPSAHKSFRYVVEPSPFNIVEHERKIDFQSKQDSAAKKISNVNLKK